MTPPLPTLSGVILAHKEAFLNTHPANRQVRRLLGLLPLCRTSALGGHLHRCAGCGYEQPRYNPCGNRHCPSCQARARHEWVERQEEALLPVPYFHLVFTLPAEIQLLLLQNKREGYSLLFQSVASTLQTFGRDPRHGLEGQLGFTAVLHTWSQTLCAHAHLHVLIPAGALSPDKSRFRKVKNSSWLFPVRAMSKVYRAIFLKGLRNLAGKGRLEFHGNQAHLAEPAAFDPLCTGLGRKDWVVYAKRPFSGPAQVLRYLGRYTHRVAISNERIERVDSQGVRFHYRDRKNGSCRKTMRLDGPEFLRRFFLHTLPEGFTRIRHYGFLANNARAANLDCIRNLLGLDHAKPASPRPEGPDHASTPPPYLLCPQCKKDFLQVVVGLKFQETTGPPPS